MEPRRRAVRPARATLVAAVLALSAGLSIATVGSAAADRLLVESVGDRVTVHAVGVPAKDVVERLRDAGLADLVGGKDLARKSVTIRVDEAPVELVMRHLLRQIGATNHAVRYDAETGLATYVVVGDSIGSVEIARDAPPPVEMPPSVPPPLPDPAEREPAKRMTGEEKGFGALLLRPGS